MTEWDGMEREGRKEGRRKRGERKKRGRDRQKERGIDDISLYPVCYVLIQNTF